MSAQPRWATALRRPWSALLATGVAVVATLLTMTGPAVASQERSAGLADCPSGAFCLWDGTNFTGALFTVGSLVSPGVCVSLVDHGWGDRAHSVRNTLRGTASMFMNDDCIGGPWGVPGGTAISNLGSFTPDSVWVPRT